MILNVETIPDRVPTSDDDNECTLPPRLCQAKELLAFKVEKMRAPVPAVKAAIAAKVAAMRAGIKGCHGRIRPHHGAGAPKAHDHHGHGGSHHRVSFAANKVARVLAHIVLPILVGVAAGMTASALGLLLGRLIVFVWIHCKRGGKRGSCALAGDGEEAILAEGEKDGLMDGQEEEPPVYEELDGVAVQAPVEKEIV